LKIVFNTRGCSCGSSSSRLNLAIRSLVALALWKLIGRGCHVGEVKD
jgi:hypothetical protein